VISAAELAQSIRDDRPKDMRLEDFLIEKFPTVTIGVLKQALRILIEIEEQDIAEQQATGERPR
jgi:hypothetical protein